MLPLHAVGCTTADYVASFGSTVIEERNVIDDDDQPFEDENNVDGCDEVSADVDGPSSDELPLLFFFTLNLLVEACTMTTSLRLVQR